MLVFAGSIEVKTVDPQLWVSPRRNSKWPCYLEAEFNFPNILAWICLHLCVCVLVCMHSQVYVCRVEARGQWSTSGVYLDHYPSYIMNLVSQLNPEVANSSRDALTLPLVLGLLVDHHACQGAMWVLGIWILVLTLWGQLLYPLSHLESPNFSF